MDLVAVIRHQVLVEGRSKRWVAREHRIGRNTLKAYLAGKEPGVRIATHKRTPVHDAIAARAVAMLEDSPSFTSRKQRLTSSRLHELLRLEGHDIGCTFVKQVMREWKRERREVFVPLVYQPGELAEVDFFEVDVVIEGKPQKAFLFLMRLMYSGRDCCFVYPRQDATCFLDGHVRAFAHLGGIPWRIVYDNLKAAVARILVGSERELQKRFAALSAHYAFEPCFARPYTGHDKGGVEARGKGIRWQHMVPVPQGPSLVVLSEQLQQRIDERLDKERVALEQPHLLELPARPFSSSRKDTAVVSRAALVKVDAASYSVPSEQAGLTVDVRAGVFDIELGLPDGTIVTHPRVPKGQRSVDYRHYLKELQKKPQAVRQVAHVLTEQLGPPFAAYWMRIAEQHGDKDAARLFAKVLGLIEQRGVDVVAEHLRRDELPPLLHPPRPPPLTVPDAFARFHVETSDLALYDLLLQNTKGPLQ